jgi:hypothetical protein
MRLRDFGKDAAFDWFQQILEWSRKKITFQDNVDCIFITATISTAETTVGHQLGRIPQYILEVASWPNSAKGIELTKAPTSEKVFLKRTTAGQTTLLLM